MAARLVVRRIGARAEEPQRARADRVAVFFFFFFYRGSPTVSVMRLVRLADSARVWRVVAIGRPPGRCGRAGLAGVVSDDPAMAGTAGWGWKSCDNHLDLAARI